MIQKCQKIRKLIIKYSIAWYIIVLHDIHIPDTIYTYTLIREMTNGYCTLRWQTSDLISASNLWRNSTKSVFPLIRLSWRTTWTSFDSSYSFRILLKDHSSSYITNYLSFYLACAMEDPVKNSCLSTCRALNCSKIN